MKINVTIRRRLGAGSGLRVDHADGNSLITAPELTRRITALETSVSSLNSTVTSLSSSVTSLGSRVTTLEGKLSGYSDTSITVCGLGTKTFLTK